MNKFDSLFKILDDSIDAVLITSDINRRYFTRMKSSAGYLLAFKEKAYLIIDFRYIEKAKAIAQNCEVVLLTDLKSQLNELLSINNATNIAVESDTVTIKELANIKKLIGDYNIDASDSLSYAIRDLRAVKSQDEIEKITKAQRIAEDAFEHICGFIKPGVTEKEIALELDFFMLKNGAEALSFDTIALTGKNTSLPHGVPSDCRVQKGDFVLMDYGAVYEGYHSDMTRTVCVGEPREEMKKIYEIVLDAQLMALKAVRANMTGAEIDSIARDYIAQQGYGDNFGHGLGHGVGMEIHEYPNCSKSGTSKLLQNMIVTIEPGIYIPGKFGVRIEDFVVITNNGYNNITKSVKKLICIK